MENPVPNQLDPDQDQYRSNGNVVGESTNMTIEFLRARLLAERSVSRTARQRADTLAKRVVELEEQLKIVSLQRRKAEKATADVLAILENRGVSDYSEEFDSSSDQEINNFESKIGNNLLEEESSVGSEIETSSLTSRSLSWKSGKDSPSSGGKKIINSYSNKKIHFSSRAVDSPRRNAGGKSCRRIRQRETRSAVEGHTNGTTQVSQENGDDACAEGCPTSPGSTAEISKSRPGNRNLEIIVKGSGGFEGTQSEANSSDHLHGRSNELERALEHQVQLIGQYEEEEKAQREWEEKFRENDSSPASCERGTTQSDITEEIDETKAESSPYPVGGNGPMNFEARPYVETNLSTDQSSSTSKLSDHQPSQPLASLSKGEDTLGSKSRSLDSLPHIGADKLGSVLEALQQAKLSLNSKIIASPPLNGGSMRKSIEYPQKDKPEVPVGCAGLFKVPSDFYPASTTTMNAVLALNPRSSLANYYPNEQTAVNPASQLITSHPSETWPRFLSHPNNYAHSGLNINGGVRASPSADVPFPSPYLYNSQTIEMNNVQNSYASPRYPLCTDPMQTPYGGKQPLLGTGINRLSLVTPYGEDRPFSSADMNQVRSSHASLNYSLCTDPMVFVPSDGERVFSGTGVGRVDLPFHNHIQPNLYR